MNRIALISALLTGLLLTGCGAAGNNGDTTTYSYPSVSMEPTIAAHAEVTADLDAYRRSSPQRGDIVVFHPPTGADGGIACGVRQLPSEACPKPTSGLSSQTFIKRIVAVPGDELSIRDGLPILDGRSAFAQVIRKCPRQETEEQSTEPGGCELPKQITIPPGHYFLMGDNSGASFDSRFWGPVPRAAILGRVELP